jgi:3-oxoacyl-[acyl-carrier protein] reductase
VEAAEGTPTILVNNAGITRDGLLMRMSADDWQAVLDTDLSAVYRTCKAVMRGMMKARKGRIVNIASVIGVMGNAGQTNYAAAKAGMIGFSKSLAREVGSRNITVNVVAPGFIVTDMTDALGEDQKTSLLTQVPLGRLGSPDDIAAAVAFLAGPEAAYITGETLHKRRYVYDLIGFPTQLDPRHGVNIEYAPHAGPLQARIGRFCFLPKDPYDNEQY